MIHCIIQLYKSQILIQVPFTNTIGPRKVDSVLAVGIWVGFGPELGSEKTVRK